MTSFDIVEKGSSRVFGRDVLRLNIEIVKTVAESLKTALGPNGMDKMLIDEDGIIWITNHGSTLMNKMAVENPAGRILVEASKATDKEVGDGTVSTIILAANFLKNCEYLIKKKIHPTILANGCLKASEKTIELMRQYAISVNLEDKEILYNVAKTSLSGTVVAEDSERLAELVVDAVFKVAEEVGDSIEVDLQNINLRKSIAGSFKETELVNGFAFLREIPHPDMPRRIEKAKVLTVKGELRIKKRGKTKHYEHAFVLESSSQVTLFKRMREGTFKEIADKIAGTGANVVIVEKGLDDLLLFYLARAGILAIRRVVIEDLERIAKAVGATIVADLDYTTFKDLGDAETVEARKMGGKDWIFIEGCKSPRSVTIVVRGSNEYALNEGERSINDGLNAVRDVLKCPKVVAGGGAIEMRTAVKLREWAQGMSSRERFAIEAFADALESIPLTLAENAGLDPLDVLTRLRAHHIVEKTWSGVDVLNRGLSDMIQLKVLDPLLVKEQVVNSASEAASMILRIDGMIKARELSKEEMYEKKKEKGADPAKIKKMLREYGMDGAYP